MENQFDNRAHRVKNQSNSKFNAALGWLPLVVFAAWAIFGLKLYGSLTRKEIQEWFLHYLNFNPFSSTAGGLILLAGTILALVLWIATPVWLWAVASEMIRLKGKQKFEALKSYSPLWLLKMVVGGFVSLILVVPIIWFFNANLFHYTASIILSLCLLLFALLLCVVALVVCYAFIRDWFRSRRNGSKAGNSNNKGNHSPS